MNKYDYNLEEAYNELDYSTKEDIGFPPVYMFLTSEQERFILELYKKERLAVKESLLETVQEMKGLIDEL